MTTDTPTVAACPTCGATTGVAMSDGTRLCLGCRHEWNPHAVPAGPTSTQAAPTTAEAAAGPVRRVADVTGPAGDVTGPDDVLGPPPSEVAARAAQAELDALIGTDVILEGGQRATLVGFPDDDHAEVRLYGADDDATTVTVDVGDVERSVDVAPPALDVDAPTAEALARVNMAVAGLVIQAGLSAIAGEYPNAELITPATGWLPIDADGLPALEQGAAYAIAFLVHAFSIDREMVGAIATMLLTDAQNPEPTKGGST